MSTEDPDQADESGIRDIIGRALASGQKITINVRSENGAPIRSGSHIVDAHSYELVTPASIGSPEERETALYLITEAGEAPDMQAALARLFEVAFRHSGQSRIVAKFLLAWSNGPAFGGFVVSDLFGLDRELAADAATVFTHLSQRSSAAYVDAYGFGREMRQLAERYLPHAG